MKSGQRKKSFLVVELFKRHEMNEKICWSGKVYLEFNYLCGRNLIFVENIL